MYQIIEFFLVTSSNNDNDNTKRLTDNWVLLLNAIPYLFDFIAGLVSIVLIYRIAIFNDLIKEKEKWEKGISEKDLNEKVFLFFLLLLFDLI